jgi:hypothetical protein
VDAVVDPDLDPTMAVSPKEVARRVGLDPNALTSDQTEYITDVIYDVQADVEAYLRRPIFAVPRTFEGEYAAYGVDPDDNAQLLERQSWPRLRDVIDDDWTVTAVTPSTDGNDTYDVTVNLGVDGRNERPVRRFLVAHAIESIRNDPNPPTGLVVKRRITSVSAEGQSISYDRGSTTAGAAGGPPSLDSLKAYRRSSSAAAPATYGPLAVLPRRGPRLVPVRSLWASVQGDPVFMRRVNGWLTIFWIVLIPVSGALRWVASNIFISYLSEIALVLGSWSAWQAARVEVKQDAAAAGTQ